MQKNVNYNFINYSESTSPWFIENIVYIMGSTFYLIIIIYNIIINYK